MSPAPFFSVVIPTRNESRDILATLHSIRANPFSDYEVLVVDASTDDTPPMVQNFGDPRVRLLKQNNRDGRCGARNQGIRDAVGEVVVILNADVRLPTDFFSRLKAHYDKGADYVIVDSTVENWKHPFGAMVEAEHRFYYQSGREAVNWSEGYSCRRRCAMEAGLFPEGLVVPVCAGEDAIFGAKIARNCKRAEDDELVVPHAVPEDFFTFWSQRVGRGKGCSQRLLLLDHWTMGRTFRDALLWSLKSMLWITLLFPMIRHAQKLHRLLPEVSTSRMVWPVFLSRLGHEIGRWQGLIELLQKKK